MPTKKVDKNLYYVFGLVGIIFALFYACHAGRYAYQHSDAGVFAGLINAFSHMTQNPLDIFPLSQYTVQAIGIIGAAALFVFLFVKSDKEKTKGMMPGKESGSAKWYTDMDDFNKKYSDPKGSKEHNGSNNAILSQDVFLNMDTRTTRFNNNVLVIGGSGSGKSRFYVKPNILQANSNYVITDPAGELLISTGKFLESQGYEIKIFNLVEMAKSYCYNPFNYIRDDEGVLTMIDCLITNTTPPNTKGGDQFWVKSETALLQALCFYLVKYRPKEEQNFHQVMRLLRAAEIDENNPDKHSRLDDLFERVRLQDPDSIAYKQYMTFKMGAGKTLKSILISCAVRLTVFNLPQISALTSVDTIDLASMSTGKKALFVITPQASDTYNFLVSMLYSQLFETLYHEGNVRAQTQGTSMLERDIRFLLDEFVNIGQIPAFTKKLATMRKYGISCAVIIQNIAQLKPLYEDWETIIGNCDSILFLGGHEYSTLEYLSNILGITTITVRNSSRSRGKSNNSSQSWNRSQRKLLNPDELGNIDNKMCVIKIRSLDPFMTPKYDYPKHPNYKFTGDADPKNEYVNTLNNNKPPNSAEALLRAEETKRRIAKRSNESILKKDKLYSEPIPFSVFVNTFNVQNAEALFDRFSFVETYNLNVAPEISRAAEKTVIKQVTSAVARENIEKAIETTKTESDKLQNNNKPNPVINDKRTERSSLAENIAEVSPEEVKESMKNWAFD